MVFHAHCAVFFAFEQAKQNKWRISSIKSTCTFTIQYSLGLILPTLWVCMIHLSLKQRLEKMLLMILFVKRFILFFICVYVSHWCTDAPRGQKTAPDYLKLNLWATSCGCWEQNSNPLEEQQGLLITGPFLKSPIICVLCFPLSYFPESP